MRLVTLEQVESQLARGFCLLRFAPEIETLFLRQYAAERARLVATWCLIGVLIYDLVYFADRDMVPDVRTGLIVVRFLIFTPFVIACIFVVRRWPNARLYDSLTVVAAVLSVTLPMVVAVKSTSHYLFVYQTYNSAAFLFFVVSLRPRFPAVLAGLTLASASHFTTTYLTGAFDHVAYFGIVSVYSMLSIFLAVSAYFLEKSDRQNFLNQLRAGLLYRQLEGRAERDELTGLLIGIHLRASVRCCGTKRHPSRPSRPFCLISTISSGSTTCMDISRGRLHTRGLAMYRQYGGRGIVRIPFRWRGNAGASPRTCTRAGPGNGGARPRCY